MFLFVQFVCTFGVTSGKSILITKELVDKCNIGFKFFICYIMCKMHKIQKCSTIDKLSDLHWKYANALSSP